MRHRQHKSLCAWAVALSYQNEHDTDDSTASQSACPMLICFISLSFFFAPTHVLSACPIHHPYR